MARRWRAAGRALAKRQKRPLFGVIRGVSTADCPIAFGVPRTAQASRCRRRIAHACKYARPPRPLENSTMRACDASRKHPVSFAKAFHDHAPVANDSPNRRIASAYWKSFPDPPARREVMRRVALVVVLCAATFVAACSDDAPHDAHTADGSPPAGASSGSASAFNSGAGASAAASEAAPLAPPVVHYPPDDDDDAKPATNAGTSGVAASSPH
jgi:hypothetical protein